MSVIESACHLGRVMPITPSYQRIVEDITRQITTGELGPGDKLPSTSQLREQYGVSGTAIRNAMLVLRSQGLVEGHQGKGVYVAARPQAPPAPG
ncbi:MAG TPA: winged helix-turn-helix domain-containing protein [Catenuloplanes sp.]